MRFIRSAWSHARVQTGRLRQYVMFIVVGTVALFMLIKLFPEFAWQA